MIGEDAGLRERERIGLPGGISWDEVNFAPSATTWCWTVSLFVHLTVSPNAIVTLVGEKPLEVMSTVFVAANAGASTSSGAAHAITRNLFMETLRLLVIRIYP